MLYELSITHCPYQYTDMNYDDIICYPILVKDHYSINGE